MHRNRRMQACTWQKLYIPAESWEEFAISSNSLELRRFLSWSFLLHVDLSIKTFHYSHFAHMNKKRGNAHKLAFFFFRFTHACCCRSFSEVTTKMSKASYPQGDFRWPMKKLDLA
jgi:hypothetical protein